MNQRVRMDMYVMSSPMSPDRIEIAKISATDARTGRPVPFTFYRALEHQLERHGSGTPGIEIKGLMVYAVHQDKAAIVAMLKRGAAQMAEGYELVFEDPKPVKPRAWFE